jgi:hypothetical protein
MITVVITANGRDHLLRRTLESFEKFNTYKDVKIIIRDDSRDRIGQVNSIDELYKQIDTEFFFHCEEDWLFTREGFIEKSLMILESDPKILTVWLRHPSDTNGHPVDPTIYHLYNNVTKQYELVYQLMGVNALGNNWHGFTWNPGLRRLSDYKLVAPFSNFYQVGDFAALTECRIGIKYYELGFRAAILPEGYCKHIG